MVKKVRMCIAALMVVLALLGSTWIVRPVPSVLATDILPGENRP